MKKLAIGALALGVVVGAIACTAGTGPLPSGEFSLYEPPKAGGDRGVNGNESPGTQTAPASIVCSGSLRCTGTIGGQAFTKTVKLKERDGRCEGDGRYYGVGGKILDGEGNEIGTYVLLKDGGFTGTLADGSLTCVPTADEPDPTPTPVFDAGTRIDAAVPNNPDAG
jgi:hypothetical protein